MNDTDLTTDDWRQVPALAKHYLNCSKPLAHHVNEMVLTIPSADNQEEGYGRVWYQPETKVAMLTARPDLSQTDADAWQNMLLAAPGVKMAVVLVGRTVPDFPAEPWILVKQGMEVKDLTGPIAEATGWSNGPLNSWMGGPNTLGATLASGALGAGLGYGAGWLGEQVLPKKYFERGKLRRAGAVLGGAGAGIPAAWWGLRGGFGKHLPWQETKTASFRQMREDLCTVLGIDDVVKQAIVLPGAGGAGGFMPAIPVDSFNRMIWVDPFTPPQIQAQATGLVTAASNISGSPWVSPMDIARIGAGMGSGYLSGMVVGKALGALAGLKPDAQVTLQRTGAWAGFLKNVMPMMF